ncbi:MAG: methyltransferase domain-containing protein [Alphaproteobacteria bacterium]|jgi:predicted TPR repeat methyltransferase|nr:methyltransferase domain-containing protein [Alphaproteobacteria bacterium]
MSETLQPFPPSCGVPLADRRFVFALQLLERGDGEAAIDLILQAEELAPDWPPFPFRRGELLMAAGRRDEAVAAFKRCLQRDAADRLGAVIKLALLGAVPDPPQLPPGYVAALFDQYAPRFDVKLVERLGYCVPELLAAAIAELKPARENDGRVLDLGCGTGLAAEAVRRRAAWLEGVDLSAGMLDQARRKGL